MRNIYRETFDQIHASEQLREEVANMTKQKRTAPRHRISKVGLIAAVLLVVLGGTTLAAVGMPQTLRDWFALEWQERTDKDISLEQLAVIDHLTQTVGVSDTQNGTTVTLDSVTVGNSSMWMMLKVSGTYSENEALRYHFDKIDITLAPDPDQQTNTPGSHGFVYPYSRVMEDGSLLILTRYQVDLAGLSSLTDVSREAVLVLSGVVCNNIDRSGDKDVVLAEGDWTLRFTLEPQTGDVVAFPDPLQVRARNVETQEMKSVTFRDVKLTATDITYIQSQEDQMYEPQPALVLEDGSVIETAGGSARFRDEGYTEWSSVKYWPVPVDLDQVKALRMGDTEIPLP